MKNLYAALLCAIFSIYSWQVQAQLTEDFEVDPPAGWSFYAAEVDDPGFEQTTLRANSGTASFYHNDLNIAAPSESWMVSPAHTVTAGEGLSFFYNQNWTASFYDYSGVWISTTGSDPLANPGDYTELIELNADAPGGFSEDLWTEHVENLDAFIGQTIFIGFRYVGDFAHELYIDDFAIAPPAGDACSSAISISTGNQNTGEITGSFADTPASACLGGDNARYFLYTAPADGDLTVSSAGTGVDTQLSLATGTCGSLTEVACSDDIAFPAEPESELTAAVTSGTDYYIIWTDQWSSSASNFTVDFLPASCGDDICDAPIEDFTNCDDCPPPPVGDDCQYPDTVACGETILGSTVGRPVVSEAFCGTSNGTGGAVWYYFLGTGDDVIVSLCGSDFDTKVRVYEGNCGSLECVTGDDDNFAECGPGNNSQTEIFSTTAGTEYRILVHGFGSAEGDYTLNVSCFAPPGADCSTAIDISGLDTAQTGDYVGTVIDAAFQACYSAGSNPTASQWFSYTPDLDGDLTVTSQGSGEDTQLNILTGTCDALVEVGCDDDFFGAPPWESQVTVPVTGGTTYYIVWTNGWGPASGGFSLDLVDCPGPVTAPFTESFDLQVLPACWASTVPWVITDVSPGFPFCSAGVGENTGNGGFMMAIDYSNDPSDALLITPQVDVTALTTPTLSFDYYACNTDVPGLVNEVAVEVSNGVGGWIQIALIDYLTEGWETLYFDISGFDIEGLVQVRLRANEDPLDAGIGNSFVSDVHVDNLTIDNGPDCVSVLSVSFSNITETSATASWEVDFDADVTYTVSILEGGLPVAGYPDSTGHVGTSIDFPGGLALGTNYEVIIFPECTDSLPNNGFFWTTSCPPTEQCQYRLSLFDFGNGEVGGSNGWPADALLTLTAGNQVNTYTIPPGTYNPPGFGSDEALLIVEFGACPLELLSVEYTGTDGTLGEDIWRLDRLPLGSGLSFQEDAINGRGLSVVSCPACEPPVDLSASEICEDAVTLDWSNLTSYDSVLVTLAWGPPIPILTYTSQTLLTGATLDQAVLTNIIGARSNGLTQSPPLDTEIRVNITGYCTPDQPTDPVQQASINGTYRTPTCLCADQCYYALEGCDTFGDGWNGHVMQIILDGDTVLNFTVDDPVGTTDDSCGDGYVILDTVYTCPGQILELYHIDGAFDGEVNFTLTSSVAGVVYSTTNANVPGTLFTEETCPDCIRPNQLGAIDILGDGATIVWNDVSGEGSATVTIVPTGDDISTGTPVAVSDTFLVASGLDGNTTYDAYVTSVCAAGDSEPVFTTFTTGAGCGDTGVSFCYPIGTNAVNVQIATYSAENPGDWVQINIASGSFETNFDTFFAWDDVLGGNEIFSSDGNIGGTEIISTTGTIVLGYESDFSISCGSGSQTPLVYDILCYTPATCPEPTALSSSNSTQVGATLAWNAGFEETQWDVQVVPAGDAAPLDSDPGNAPDLSTNSYVYDQGEGATSYDFYVRADCGAGDESAWVGPFTFSTQTLSDQYCDAGPTTLIDSNVEQVDLIGENGTAISFTGCPGVTGVQDLTTSQSVELMAGSTYALDVLFGTCGGNFTGVGSAWIDFGADLEFGTDELIGSSGPALPGSAPWDAPVNFTFIVPPTAANGPTILRVIQAEAGSLPLDACWTDQWGSVMDFSVEIFGGVDVTCPKPTSLSAVATSSSATLSWTENGDATEWEVEVVPAVGSFTGSGTVTSDNPYIETGLLSSRDYKFRVRAICGPGDESDWSSEGLFTTGADYCSGDAFTDSGGETGNYSNNELITYVICPDSPGDIVYVTFTSVDIETAAGGGIQNGCWDFLTVYDGPSVASPVIAQTLCGEESGDGGAPSVATSLLSVGDEFVSSDASGCLTFVFDSDGSITEGGWVASVVCAPPPNCPEPTDLAASNIQSDAADVSFVSERPGSDYGYSYGPEGFTVGGTGEEGSGTGTTSATSTVSLSDLASATTYQFCVWENCEILTPGDGGSDTTCFTFTTLPDYCAGDLFLDSGGETAGYGNNELVTYVICPDNSGDVVTLTFTFVDIESSTGTGIQDGCWDFLSIYDGPTTASTTIAQTLCGEESGDGGVPGTASSELNIGDQFISTDASGCLTVVFDSDGVITEQGWVAEVDCGPPPTCPRPDDLAASTLSPSEALFTWSPGGSETEWIVEYGPSSTEGTNPTVTVTGSPSLGLAGLAAGDELFVWVTAVCGVDDLSQSFGPLSYTQPGAGAICETAIEVSLPYSFSGSTEGSGFDYQNGDYADQSCGNGFYDGGEDLVFQYTPVEDQCVNVNITVDAWLGAWILDGCPDDPASSCVEFVEGGPGGVTETLSEIGLTAGTDYFIVVDTWPAPDFGNVSIDIEVCPDPPLNDDCVNAQLLEVELAPDCVNGVPGTLIAASASSEAISAECFQPTALDVWYKAEVPAAGVVEVTFLSMPGTAMHSALYTGSDNGTACNLSYLSGSCGNVHPKVYEGLTPGDMIYIRVWDTGNNDLGDFEICLSSNEVDCSVYETAPVDLSKSFEPVNGIYDRVQLKWYKDSPQITYSDEDAAACDLKIWAKRNLDPVFGTPVGPVIQNPDTISLVNRRKFYPNGDPREIFKWPLLYFKLGENNGKRVLPNVRYEWQVRCACEHGAGVESPWSGIRIFNTPDFDPISGTWKPPGGAIVNPDGDQSFSLKADALNLVTANIYPNPSTGEEIMINLMDLSDENQKVIIEITDMTGKIVHTEQRASRGTEANFIVSFEEPLASGLYLVNLYVDDAKLIEKLTIE